MSENWGAWTLFILAVVGYGAYHLYGKYETAKMPTLQQQRMCAEQADKFYKESGSAAGNGVHAFYDHYSLEFGRCFVEISQRDFEAHSTSLDLYDAFEGKEYGDYFAIYRDGESKVAICRIMGLDGKDHTCKSENEFTDAAKSYIP